MIDIIREPKVSKRGRALPFARRDSGHAKMTAEEARRAAGNATRGKPNGTAADSASAEESRKAVAGNGELEALHAANERADAAEERVAQFEQEVEGCFAEAREKGFEKGHRMGCEEAREKVDADSAERLRRLDGLCAKVGTEFSENLDSAVQDSVVEVVFAAAGKLIGDAMADRDAIVGIVENMTRNVEASHNIRVRVSPADFDFLSGGDWVPPKRNGNLQLEFVPDKRIELGGCIIETTHGDLDARLETQLRRLKEVLVETRSKQLSGTSQ
jgi:flagellar assembly protein FliH